MTPLETIRSSSDVCRGARVALLAAEPGAYVLDSSSAYRVAVHTGRPHRLWEWQDGRSHDGPHQRGDVAVTAVGESRRVRWDRPTELVAIELAPEFVCETAAGFDVDLAQAKIVGSFSRRDPMLEHLAFALVAELEDGLPNGPLFGEAVATAMAARLVREYGRGRVPRGRDELGGLGGLSPRTLANVVEYVHAALAEPIALGDLAKIANLSVFHFGRAFRTSTGRPPHAYVIGARVEEATRLTLGGARISEAAASAGFSSQGHLTRHMRRLLGITPGMLVRSRRAKRP